MESFLAFSKKCISASAGVIPLITKKKKSYKAAFHFLSIRLKIKKYLIFLLHIS
jgi:hypothetical protein